MIKKLTIKSYGQVQGVFFRAFVKEKAVKLGLVGWARNAPDGSVEVLAEGEEENLKKLVDACKEGPKFAKVDRVEVEWTEAEGRKKEFKIEWE